jgi:hypothetical protein
MVISFLYVSQFLVRCLRDARHIGCPPEPRRSSQQITPSFRIGITCLRLGRIIQMLKYLKAKKPGKTMVWCCVPCRREV